MNNLIDIKNVTSEQIEEEFEKCFLDLKRFAKVIFPETFFLPFSYLHDQIFEVLNDNSIQQAVFVAPRGLGKSTLIGKLFPAHRILYQVSKSILSVGASYDMATDNTDGLQYELMNNPMIQAFFGVQKSAKFAQDSWITKTSDGKPGTRVMPKGAGQKFRGSKYGDYRPDLILVDDLENDESAASDEQTIKLQKWFDSALMNTIDEHRGTWRAAVLGTPLGPRTVLQRLQDSSHWTTVKLSLCSHTFKSAWPEYYSDEKLLAKVDYYRENGDMDIFAREFMGEVASSEDAAFPQRLIKQAYYDPNSMEEYNRRHETLRMVIVDPSKTVKFHSDETGIMGLAYHPPSGVISIIDMIMEKMHPDQVIKNALDMADYIDARFIGVEVTSLHEWVTRPFLDEIAVRGRGVKLIELHAKGKKEDRVKGMTKYFRTGKIKISKVVAGLLEFDLMKYPFCEKWHLMDCLGYVEEMLHRKELYSHPIMSKLYTMEDEELAYEALKDSELPPRKRSFRCV